MDLLESLNPVQKQAVQIKDGPLLLLAGAGSGKTMVLTHRIAYLIQNGVNPFNILAITFTNKAASEMRERVNMLTPEGSQVWVSTFHSTCVRILRREINKIGFDNSFTIYDADDSERLIKNCIKDLNINDKQFPAKSVMGTIGSRKDELISPTQFEAASVGDYRMTVISGIYTLYQKKLKLSNALDFDDIIFRTVELFTARPDVLEKYQDRFRYILVDEYQDTNTAQYRLIEMLAEKHKNLCVVGDDDQSIYGWRGANIRNILNFEDDFHNARVIKLEQNYRSTKTILNAANAVINNNSKRKDKKLWTENEKGDKLQYHKAGNENEEAAFICEVIADRIKSGEKYSNFAVLYRTNAQSRAIEDQFVRSNIPYRLFGGVRFYERREVKDILAYMRATANPFDNLAYTRIINVPKRGIGDSTVDKISDYADNMGISFSDALNELENIDGIGARRKKLEDFSQKMREFREFAKDNSVKSVLEKILAETSYVLELYSEGTDEAQGRIENVNELVSKAAEFEASNETPTLAAFLEEVSLVSDIDNYEQGEDTVSMMTMHSSKGLEFPCVFITGFEDGIFPSYRSVVSGDRKDIEEERRLCYVGITRARNCLYITSANSRMQRGQVMYNSISRFFKEIPPESIDNIIRFSPAIATSRKGISKFSVTAKAHNSIDISFGGKNYTSPSTIPAPKNIKLEFSVGDKVKQMKYGVGTVKDIRSAGADYEVTVEFEDKGVKKFMANLSKLSKV